MNENLYAMLFCYLKLEDEVSGHSVLSRFRNEVINTLIRQQWHQVERIFGSMKRWFGSGIRSYIGIAMTDIYHVLDTIAHNPKRNPSLVVKARCVLMMN